MNEELTNEVVEGTVNVATEAAKEGLSLGGWIIGGLTVTGAISIGYWAYRGGKWIYNKVTSKKGEPLADKNFKPEVVNFNEVEEDEEDEESEE